MPEGSAQGRQLALGWARLRWVPPSAERHITVTADIMLPTRTTRRLPIIIRHPLIMPTVRVVVGTRTTAAIMPAE